MTNGVLAATAVLTLGGGILAAVGSDASAGGAQTAVVADEKQAGDIGRQPVSVVDCPDVGRAIPRIPPEARAEVRRELAALDAGPAIRQQEFSAQAWERILRDPALAEDRLLTPLRNERLTIIQRVASLLPQEAEPPQGLESLAPCTLQADDNNGVSADPGGGAISGNENGNEEDVSGARNDGSGSGDGNENGNGNGNGDGRDNGNTNGNENGNGESGSGSRSDGNGNGNGNGNGDGQNNGNSNGNGNGNGLNTGFGRG
ncbi:hypothetical protein ACFYYR_25365 [Streptomyces sp. NPDC001922]|uniref:hypothetical protein n=1 Tax=Streptomyces sp. NPDC001922 TaxID=3364624 RepID=UPI0036C21ABD